MITPAMVADALRRIAPHVRRTPLAEVDVDGRRVWLKLEQLQHAGSFKFRGAVNRLLAAEPAGPVVTASGGNHGIAVALASARLERKATVFVPTTVPAAKKEAIVAAGADLREAGAFYAQAEAAARDHADTLDAVFVHPYEDPLVAAGQGTCLAEALVEQPGIDLWALAVGGGGLLAGSLAAANGRVQVAAVEPVGAPTLARAVDAGAPVRVDIDTVTASALGASTISTAALTMVQQTGTRVTQVGDDAIRDAQRRLWRDYRLHVEVAAATAFAALIRGQLDVYEAREPCILLCGANTGLGE